MAELDYLSSMNWRIRLREICQSPVNENAQHGSIRPSPIYRGRWIYLCITVFAYYSLHQYTQNAVPFAQEIFIFYTLSEYKFML